MNFALKGIYLCFLALQVSKQLFTQNESGFFITSTSLFLLSVTDQKENVERTL